MKNNHGYEINHGEKTIIVTKKFLKEAGIIGSDAYNDLARVRKDLPDFQIIPREIKEKKGKRTYGDLTYDRMKDFIMDYEGENSFAVLAEYERVKQLSKAHSGPYAYVKKWFLNRYKDEFAQENKTAEAKA